MYGRKSNDDDEPQSIEPERSPVKRVSEAPENDGPKKSKTSESDQANH